MTALLLILLGVLVVIGLAVLIPFTRKLIQNRIVPLVRDAATGLRELARKPRKLFALFGGSIIITFGFYGALLCAVQAFGGGPTPAEIGVAYLAAFAIAILSPTPGGTGPLELALIAAFTRLGMENAVATSAVLLFRIGTLWLPALPGWLMLGFLQRRGDL